MPKLWNAYGLLYDTITDLGPYREMIDEVVADLELAPGMRVLDAGCGTGVLAERIVALHPEVEVLGVDLSRTMLSRARARRAWPATVSFLEATIEDALAKDTRGFDRIASVNVIWTLPNPQDALARMAACVRPGGHMVHTTPGWHLRPSVILWRHLRAQRGWGLVRALFRLPKLALAGVLNLALVIESFFRARPTANRKWSREGLIELLGAAGVNVREVRPCYADQGYLLRSERKSPLPGEG